jgi:hypothetical protein
LHTQAPSSAIVVSSGVCSTTLANRFIGVHAESYVMVCGALTSDWYPEHQYLDFEGSKINMRD